ncbi:MAG: hypothetical protein WC460_00025 [Patescibacteria group bacterium]
MKNYKDFFESDRNLIIAGTIAVAIVICLIWVLSHFYDQTKLSKSNATPEQIQNKAMDLLNNMSVEERQKFVGITPPATAPATQSAPVPQTEKSYSGAELAKIWVTLSPEEQARYQQVMAEYCKQMKQVCYPCGKKPGHVVTKWQPPRKDPLPPQTANNSIQNTVPVNFYVTSTCVGNCRTDDFQPPAHREPEPAPISIAESPPAPVQTQDIVNSSFVRYKEDVYKTRKQRRKK